MTKAEGAKPKVFVDDMLNMVLRQRHASRCAQSVDALRLYIDDMGGNMATGKHLNVASTGSTKQHAHLH